MNKLILGPSCAGKSTYIDFLIKNQEISLDQVIYGFEFSKGKTIQNNSIVHFNILNYLTKGLNSFFEDPVTKYLIDSIENFDEIIFIVSSISDLKERAKKRDIVEKNYDKKYANVFWLKIYANLNLFFIYEEIFEYFDLKKKSFRVIWSSTNLPNKFEQIDRVYVHHILRGVQKFIFPKQKDVDEFIASGEYEYQNLLLPYSQSTINKKSGHIPTNRELFFDPIKFIDLRDSSVLDVGCALGSFLYRAERYGAKKICGIDKMEHRYNASIKIKNFLLSNAEFKNEYFNDNSIKEKFDLVLCLNVIHHVKDIDTFISNLWKATSKNLVIEFPTFLDPKFMKISKLSNNDSSNLNKLPIMGVSSIKLVDQTYVYSPSSIVGILVDRGEVEPKNIQQFKSSFDGRTILVFSK